MRILLIDPPFYRLIGYYNRYFPLGLAYLAAVLQKEGHEVLIYDADSNVNPNKMDFSLLEDSYPYYLKSLKDDSHHVWQEIREKISDYKPDIFGISVWTTFAASAFKIASLCKEYNNDIPVVMGGPHVSIKYDEVINICPHVDFLVRGEGEKTFLNLVNALSANTTKPYYSHDLSAIRGVSFRSDENIIHNPPEEFIEDLDTLPLPARDLLLNKSSYHSEDMGLLMTSRGCPFSCSYCATSIWERKTRYRSIDNVIDEIIFVINKYGSRQFTLKDDSFTVNRNRVMEFCNRLINEHIDISWDCNTRVNLVDEEMLGKMKKAGCNSIKVGIETGSENTLRLINKQITFDQCRKAARLFRQAGIHWTGYFMMGFPSETEENISQTLQFMNELKPDYASLSVYEPFPGTKLFEIGLQKGLVQSKRTLDDFYSISPKYYYVKDINRRVDTMGHEKFDRLEHEMKEAFNKYNRRFSRLVKRAKSRRRLYISQPMTLWEDIKKFRKWL